VRQTLAQAELGQCERRERREPRMGRKESPMDTLRRSARLVPPVPGRCCLFGHFL